MKSLKEMREEYKEHRRIRELLRDDDFKLE
jgi:hypothetical protein